MDTTMLGGAINPYALTEAVLGKRIEWARVEQPIALLEQTLQTPADRLFDGGDGSPVFALQRTLGAERTQRPSSTPRRGNGNGATPLGGDAIRLSADIASQLSPQISVDLKARLSEMLTPKLRPELQTTEYDNATWSDPGDFFEEGTEFADPVQGAVGDCWLIAALSSVALSRPYAIVHRNRTTGAAQGDFVNAIDVANGGATLKRFEVSEKVPVNTATASPRFARSSEGGEVWPGVYEKAFAKLRSGNQTDKPDILVLHGGDCVDASARLVPGTTAQYTNTDGTTADALWTQLRDNCVATPVGTVRPSIFNVRSGRTVNPMTCWTYAKAEDAPDDIKYDQTTRIVGWHCYSILGWISRTSPIHIGGLAKAERYIVLRNPWGTHEGIVDTLAGSWSDHEISWIRSTPLNANGVFAMRIEAFKKYYAGMGVAR